MSGGDDVTADAVTAAPDGSAAPPAGSSPDPDAGSPLPVDAAGWRAFLMSIPAREILRALQEDRERAARLLTGFRPAANVIRHPAVAERLVQEALKQPKFAEALASLVTKPSDLPTAKRSPPHGAGTPTTTKAREAGEESSALRGTIDRQRSALRDKDARIHDLETALSLLTRERDAAHADADAARAARREAEAEAERQRRRREREARRQVASPPPKPSKPPKIAPAPSAPSATPAQSRPTPATHPLDEAVTRLLNRGKYSVVADLCCEALLTKAAADSTALRGRIHAFFAAALYGEGNDAAGEEQDRLASADLLNAGQLIASAGSLARLLTHATALRSADVSLLRRLLSLAEREGQSVAVRDVFTRMRIGAPEAYRRMRVALSAGGKSAFRLLEAEREGAVVVGPEEAIALPTTSRTAATVTPRRIVQAVDAGEEGFVARVREGVATLRARDATSAAIATALLEATAAIESAAVVPLLRAATNPIVVDASNVARHTPDPLALEPPLRVANLRQMRDFLLQDGYFPVLLIADANLRFHVDDRTAYQALVDRHVVREAPSRTSADEMLIREAEARQAPLVTNDRLTEWGEAAHRVQRYGFLLLSDRVALMPA